MDHGDEDVLVTKRHIKYFERCLQVLPGRYASLDTNRMTMAFFGISGLDLLSALDDVRIPRQDMIEWIYALQILPPAEGRTVGCGFRGSTSTGATFSHPQSITAHDTAHVANTYTALACLLILGDDLSRVNRPAVAAGLAELQLPDGSFQFSADGTENDMRFIYCAACICYMLNDFSAVDVEKAVRYIMSSLSYEGGFGQGPYLECHGGSTFCAVASLWLFKRMDAMTDLQIKRLRQWCHRRQESGFQGRPNKPVDTCYSFWIGGTLQILDSYEYTDKQFNRGYILSTQDNLTGGFGKWTTTTPDPLHSYMGIAALSLLGESDIKPLFVPLNISQEAVSHLYRLQASW